MTARAIGNVLAGKAEPGTRRTFQKVHRRSFHAGERERREWRQHNCFPHSQDNARMRALEQLEREDRRANRGDRKRRREDSCILGVYRYFLRLRGRESGRLDPTYATIAAALDYAESAVKAAMKRLEALGFLRWIRRTQLLDDPEPGGQYVEQASNAYVLQLAGRAAKLVSRILRELSPEQRRRREEQETATRRAAMTSEELVADCADPALRKALGGLLNSMKGASPPTGLNDTLRGSKG